MGFDERFVKGLIEHGMQPKQATFFLKLYKQDALGFPQITEEEREWALKKGFFPGRSHLLGLNNDNYHIYLSDYAYYMMHPFNNHFRFWVNDKLTLKYILNNSKFQYCMPKYYLYIENDGRYSYLMDFPEKVEKNEKCIYNLLKTKKRLALKPNNGTEGIGFIKFEYNAGNIFYNNEMITKEKFNEIIDQLTNYTITEYCKQHSAFAEIFPDSECTLRITMGKNIGSYYEASHWTNINCFARFGSILSHGASNLDAGGIGVGIDFISGKLNEDGIRYQHFINKKDFYPYKKHPDTNVSWGDIKVPNWKLVKTKVFDICSYLSSLDYLAFDVIVTEKTVKICEINTLPAMCYGQILSGPALGTIDRRKFFEQKGYKSINTEVLFDIVKKAKEENVDR